MPIKFWQFRNSDESSAKAELLLYGPLSEMVMWGDEVTPKDFNDDLNALGDIQELKVRINSPGGDVYAGVAIYNTLVNHPATVTTYVDGLAASAASIVAMAGDTVTMPRASMLMIHNPSAMAIGDKRTMDETAAILDKVRDSFIGAYEMKTGLSADQIKDMMDSETWMTAEEAVELGFADKIDEQRTIQAQAHGRLMIVNGLGFDIGQWRTMPTCAVRYEAIPATAVSDNGSDNSTAAEQFKEAIMDETTTVVIEETPDVIQPTAEETAAEEIIEAANDEIEPVEVDAIAQAVQAERERTAAIRALSVAGCEAVIETAIADGISPEAAALRLLQSEDFRNTEARAARLRDAATVNNVTPGSAPAPLTKELIASMGAAELKARMPEIEAWARTQKTN